MTSKTSFENVKQKWCPEITHHSRNSPWILVGTKSDLRSQGGDCVTADEAHNLCKELGARVYMECSALSQHNLKEVFETAIRFVLFMILFFSFSIASAFL